MRAINARDDTLLSGSSLFKAASQRRRCAVLADGCHTRGLSGQIVPRQMLNAIRCPFPLAACRFFEWRKDEAGGRHPYFIRYPEPDRPLIMAAVYEVWKDPRADGMGSKANSKHGEERARPLIPLALCTTSWPANRRAALLVQHRNDSVE